MLLTLIILKCICILHIEKCDTMANRSVKGILFISPTEKADKNKYVGQLEMDGRGGLQTCIFYFSLSPSQPD